jgi:flagellar hook-associated protein 3 FlgL
LNAGGNDFSGFSAPLHPMVGKRHSTAGHAMPLLPVSTVRTSAPLATQRLLFQLNADQLELQRSYDQLSTGRRVLKPSEDPVAASRAIKLHRSIDQGNQWVRNGQSAIQFYQVADEALARISASLVEARAVAVQAAQTVLSQDERTALAFTLQQSIDSLIAAGNTTHQGHAVFGGLLNEGQSLQRDDQGIVDLGSGAIGQTAVGEGGLRSLNLSNRDTLGSAEVILRGTRLATTVSTSSKLVELDRHPPLDLSAGIRITQGSNAFDVDLSQATTVGDLLIAINRSGADVRAELDSTEGAIQLRALRSGVDYSVGESGGTTASQLGLRTASEATELAELGRGRGLSLSTNEPDLVIQRPDGVVLELDLNSAKTVGEVMERIRNHPLNQDALRVDVAFNEFGNGLQLTSPVGTGPLIVSESESGNAGQRLGLIPAGVKQVQSTSSAGTERVVGEDYAPREAGGALDTLLRLHRAVLAGDPIEISRLQSRLDEDLDRVNGAQGRIGIWNSTLDQLQESAEQQVIRLQSQLSEEIEADLTEVVSEMNQRQVAIEASLRLIGQTARLTVLDFL